MITDIVDATLRVDCDYRWAGLSGGSSLPAETQETRSIGAPGLRVGCAIEWLQGKQRQVTAGWQWAAIAFAATANAWKQVETDTASLQAPGPDWSRSGALVSAWKRWGAVTSAGSEWVARASATWAKVVDLVGDGAGPANAAMRVAALVAFASHMALLAAVRIIRQTSKQSRAKRREERLAQPEAAAAAADARARARAAAATAAAAPPVYWAPPAQPALMPVTTLYRFFDQGGTLLYVGVSSNPGRRFTQHSGGKDWWSQVATTTMQHFATRALALDAERVAIATERPVHNIAGRPR